MRHGFDHVLMLPRPYSPHGRWDITLALHRLDHPRSLGVKRIHIPKFRFRHFGIDVPQCPVIVLVRHRIHGIGLGPVQLGADLLRDLLDRFHRQ